MTTHHTTEPGDHALDALMRRAMDDVIAPAGLTEVARRDGARLRVRRRITGGLSVAAAAVVAVAATTTALSVLGDGDSGRGNDVLGQPEPPQPVTEEGWWTMPAGTMADKLAARLPDGMQLTDAEITNSDRAEGEQPREMQGYLVATLLPEAGGPGKVNLVLYPPDDDQPAPTPTPDAEGNLSLYGEGPTVEERLSCDPDWVSDPADCRVLRDEDGRVIGRVLDSTAGGVRSLGLDWRTEDDGIVMINVANTLDDKWPDGATPSADELPLSLRQLKELAGDPVWTSYQP